MAMTASSTAVVVIRATPAMAARLSQIAHAAKSYWGYPAQWIELWHNQLTISPDFVAKNEVWAAELEESVLGFFALTGKPPCLTLEHMWVMPAGIRQGVGTALWARAMAIAREKAAERVEIEADPNSEGFYLKMGAQTVGEVSYVLEGQRRVLPLMEVVVRR
jgi:GNAT superfamily N-acetyltransferase